MSSSMIMTMSGRAPAPVVAVGMATDGDGPRTDAAGLALALLATLGNGVWPGALLSSDTTQAATATTMTPPMMSAGFRFSGTASPGGYDSWPPNVLHPRITGTASCQNGITIRSGPSPRA